MNKPEGKEDKQMNLPCITCKHKTIRNDADRTYIGCNDPECKEKHFKEDISCFHDHECSAWEAGEVGVVWK